MIRYGDERYLECHHLARARPVDLQVHDITHVVVEELIFEWVIIVDILTFLDLGTIRDHVRPWPPIMNPVPVGCGSLLPMIPPVCRSGATVITARHMRSTEPAIDTESLDRLAAGLPASLPPPLPLDSIRPERVWQ